MQHHVMTKEELSSKKGLLFLPLITFYNPVTAMKENGRWIEIYIIYPGLYGPSAQISGFVRTERVYIPYVLAGMILDSDHVLKNNFRI